MLLKNARNSGHRSLLCKLGAVTGHAEVRCFSGRVSQWRFTCSGSCVTDGLGCVKKRSRRLDWPYICNVPVRTVEHSIGPDIAGGQRE
jgi:hypothetical protein